ncbi:MAG: hypothetical protein MJ071_07580 [Oscillospiraceae bacterium]|nr:hypothetical protein [Oscillospiraceae bacterium]
MNKEEKRIYYHLPGLFEFYELYRMFLPLFYQHREYFYDWCEIGSVYGAPADCLWNGGRAGFGDCSPQNAAALMREYGISARLTFSNSLLEPTHLTDAKCNYLWKLFARETGTENGIIIYSELLMEYLKKQDAPFYYVSSTTKVLMEFQQLLAELNRDDFRYVVPDFRWNPKTEQLSELTEKQRKKVEFLCNECCWAGCTQRRQCYENVSRKNLGELCEDFICSAPGGSAGYRFSAAMENPCFISPKEIQSVYAPMGFEHFKIEGRGLGSAMILEFLLYYMTKPEYQLRVREEIYLDSMLDLF